MSRRRATGPTKGERPEEAPFDVLAFKRKVQAEILKAIKGMTLGGGASLLPRGGLGRDRWPSWWARSKRQRRPEPEAEPSLRLTRPELRLRPSAVSKASVQSPFIRYAVDAGWTYLSPRGGPEPAARDDQPRARLRARRSASTAQPRRRGPPAGRGGSSSGWCGSGPTSRATSTPGSILKGLKTVFVEAEKRERNVRLLDPDNVEANTFHVTDEFTFSNGTPPDIRTDIMFFVNGVPIIVAETKARHPPGRAVAEALEDIRYYHRKGPELLAVMQLHALTHLIQFYYGATWNLSRKGLFNWRDEQAGDFETLVKTFIAPRRVLRVITDFILFTRKDEELSKVVLRPHQMRAVERTVQRAKDAKKRRGLIWHTQGSGKTYTMITVGQAADRRPGLPEPDRAHARGPQRAGGPALRQPGGRRLRQGRGRREQAGPSETAQGRPAGPDRLDDPQVRGHPRRRSTSGPTSSSWWTRRTARPAATWATT